VKESVKGNAPSYENGGAAPRRRVAISSSSCFSAGNAAGARDGDVLLRGFELVAVVEEESGVDRGRRIAQLIGRELFQDLDPLAGPGWYRIRQRHK